MSAGDVLDVETESKSLTRQCADDATIRGIDVSYWQGTINWDRVAGDGVEFAFIRVSDGLRHVDTQFARNWSEAKRVGVRRGAYQFFRPNLDPIAQANLLLDRMGELEAGDLPPVIDVEAAGGLSPRTIAERVQTWIDHVERQLGVTPIVYSAPYFWRDEVGSPSFSTNHHLWLAHYTTACPLVPEPWSSWTFHQYTDRGRVAGISGGVDMNLFNGTLAELDAIAVGGTPPAPVAPCEAIGQNGGLIEEDGACTELGGPTRFLRAEVGGHGGGYVWTGATNLSTTVSYASYTVKVDVGGTYGIEAYVGGGTGSSRQAKYEVSHAGGSAEVVVDQSAASGFVHLGVFTLSAGVEHTVRLVDNTGEASSLDRRLVFDAIRVTPAQPGDSPTDPNACAALPATGGILEEDGACVELGGPTQFLRAESTGHGGGRVWTGATSSQRSYNYARWSLAFEEAGLYLVEVYADGTEQGSRQSRYRVTHAGGAEEVIVDQSTAAGFVELGAFSFAQGGGYGVRLNDNTGESTRLGRQITFDALRVTRLSELPCAEVTLAPGVGALNVRSMPNTDHAAVAQLAAGQVVDRLATVSGERVDGDARWHRIRWGNMVGYVSGRFAACAD